ncbi:hypothetical protein CkaCkLH20_02367 [Colletotrichum karsti]|uniref:Uncharacterized protein n=1 Tax=Colletotrichum karsti TaxID=1095194 RepID=A0A9P6ICN0_9PEZI|nr:uncharacterized protein CkaCkLH20_02367 [Colletotrichum karsti]KAF9880413.1 hypothetical protein CkaCkLH20_02367 [Colletotrichum karsti]
MEASSAVASWIGALATAVGLGSLIAQGTVIQEQLDPFFIFRDPELLGPWAKRQPKRSWNQLWKPTPLGPVIIASLAGFCRVNDVHLTRKAREESGKASWAVLMDILNQESQNPAPQFGADGRAISTDRGIPDHAKARRWAHINVQPLVRHGAAICVRISRASLITLLSVTNARSVFRYSGDAGYRASYPSYAGLWTIEWAIGTPAIVKLSPHDILKAPGSDVYPASIHQRVDRCIEMLCGICNSREKGEDSLLVAFPGRKDKPAVLEFQSRGFAGSHGSRHLYNMVGGCVHDVDLLHRRALDDDALELVRSESGTLRLDLPSPTDDQSVPLYARQPEIDIICNVLDNLPWTTLSWSMHRGMRDILLAYGKPRMDSHRSALADVLRKSVSDNGRLLQSRGWKSSMVKGSMPDIVHATVMAGSGDSGDVVRAFTEAAFILVRGKHDLDKTDFWGDVDGKYWESEEVSESGLSVDVIVALTKFVVLEWSQELDYQMYHDLPMELLLVS